MSKTFAAIETVDDCIGFRARIGAFDLLVWLFPTDRRGFVFDLVGKRWSEWRSADTTGWCAQAIRSYYYWPERNLHLVGLADGSIAELTFDVTTEGASTKPVVGEITTGFVAHDTTYRKHCQRVTFQMRRGRGSSSTVPPRAEYSYRDDEGAFNEPEHLDLGGPGDVYPVVQLGPQGTYEMREHKLTFSGDVPMAVVNVEETFTILNQVG